MPRIAWDNMPPYEEGRYCPVVTVPPGAAQRFAILAESILGVYTHWYEDVGPRGQSGPHLLDKAACLGCRRFQRPRWTPYLACYYLDLGRHCLLQLTKLCVVSQPVLLPKHGVVLRGRYITLQRVGRAQTARLLASISDPDPAGEGWPVGVDEVSVLCRLWNVEAAGLVLSDEAA